MVLNTTALLYANFSQLPIQSISVESLLHTNAGSVRNPTSPGGLCYSGKEGYHEAQSPVTLDPGLIRETDRASRRQLSVETVRFEALSRGKARGVVGSGKGDGGGERLAETYPDMERGKKEE